MADTAAHQVRPATVPVGVIAWHDPSDERMFRLFGSMDLKFQRYSSPSLLPLRSVAQLAPFDPDLLLGVDGLKINPPNL